MKKRLFAITILGLLALVTNALAAGCVFLIQTGVDANDDPVYREADSRDTALSSLISSVRASKALQSEIGDYDSTQRDSYARALASRGYSQEQINQSLANYVPDPIFINVTGDTGGLYNDWKSRFTVKTASGQTYSIQSPVVVAPLGSQVLTSGNSGLIEQDLVHEIGHGVFAKAYGLDRIPDSDRLGMTHAGGDNTDSAFALIEGFAEACGAFYTGRLTIAEDPDNAIASNWYSKDLTTGQLKPLSQLLCTEGWVATTLYKIMENGQNLDARKKLIGAMGSKAPTSFTDLITATKQAYPELSSLIDSTIYDTTGGQAGSPAGSTVSTSSPTDRTGNNSTGGTNTPLANGSSEIVGTELGQAYDSFYQAIVSSSFSAGSLNTVYQQVLSSQNGAAQRGGTLYTLQQVGRGSKILRDLYGYLSTRLGATPYYYYTERYQLQYGMALIASLYARQGQLEDQVAAVVAGQNGLSGGSTTGSAEAPTSGSPPMGPAAPIRTEYDSLLNGLKSGNVEAARQDLIRYERILKNRQGIRSNLSR